MIEFGNLADWALVFVTGVLAYFTYQLFSKEERHGRLVDRAYVAITPRLAETDDANIIRVKVRMRNSGKTPAEFSELDVYWLHQVDTPDEFVPTTDSSPNSLRAHKELSVLLGSEGTYTLTLKSLKVEEVNVPARYFIVGRAWYRDIFRQKWNITFCWYVSSKGEIRRAHQSKLNQDWSE
jgi:hypothetical protein